MSGFAYRRKSLSFVLPVGEIGPGTRTERQTALVPGRWVPGMPLPSPKHYKPGRRLLGLFPVRHSSVLVSSVVGSTGACGGFTRAGWAVRRGLRSLSPLSSSLRSVGCAADRLGGVPGRGGAFPPKVVAGSALGCRHGELISTTHDHAGGGGLDRGDEALPAPGGWGGQDRTFGGFLLCCERV